MEQIFMEVVKHSPTLAIMGLLLYYFVKRNDTKDETMSPMHREVIELVVSVKDEMREMMQAQQKEHINVLNISHNAINNNTLALQRLSDSIEKISVK